MENQGVEKDFIRRPIPTYQQYMDHFEQLFRQSPLAKVFGQNVPPSSTKTAEEGRDTEDTPTRAGTFKVPLTPGQVLTPKSSSSAINMMPPVAQLIHKMQKQTPPSSLSRGRSQSEGALGALTRSSALSQRQRKTAADKENLGRGAEPWKDNSNERVFEPDVSDEGEPMDDQEENDDETRPEVEEQVDDDMLSNDGQQEMVLTAKEANTDDAVDVQEDALDDGDVYEDVEEPDVAEEQDAVVRGMQPEKKEGAKQAEKQQKSAKEDQDTRDSMPARRSRRKKNSAFQESVKASNEAEEQGDVTLKDMSISSKVKETALDQWIVKWFNPNRKYIQIEGHRQEDPEDAFWHSTAIVRRVTSRLVETSSGSRYRLIGKMNKLLTMDQGFSHEFVKKFERGFPAGWMRLIAKEQDRFNEKNVTTTDSEFATEKQRKMAKRHSTKDDGSKKARNRTHHKGKYETRQERTSRDSTKKRKKLASSESSSHKKKSSQTENAKDASNSKKSSQKSQEEESRQSTPVQAARLKDEEKRTPTNRKKKVAIVLITPSVHIKNVQRTHSGRKVIPPLEYWRGQRQRAIPFLEGETEILEGSTDYTSLSSSRIQLTGSVDISERLKRQYARKANLAQKKAHRKTTDGSDRGTDTIIDTDTDIDTKSDSTTNPESKGNISQITRKSSAVGRKSAKSSSTKKQNEFDSIKDEIFASKGTGKDGINFHDQNLQLQETVECLQSRKSSEETETSFERRKSKRNLKNQSNERQERSKSRSKKESDTRISVKGETIESSTDTESFSTSNEEGRVGVKTRTSSRNRSRRMQKDCSTENRLSATGCEKLPSSKQEDHTASSEKIHLSSHQERQADDDVDDDGLNVQQSAGIQRITRSTTRKAAIVEKTFPERDDERSLSSKLQDVRKKKRAGRDSSRDDRNSKADKIVADESEQESLVSSSTLVNTESDTIEADRDMREQNRGVSPRQMERLSDGPDAQMGRNTRESHSTDVEARNHSNGTKKNPYDLYGAIMGVVDKHRQIRESRSRNRSRSNDREANRTRAAAVGTNNSSYSFSDDEDLSTDSSVNISGAKQSRALSRVEVSGDVHQNQNHSLTESRRLSSGSAALHNHDKRARNTSHQGRSLGSRKRKSLSLSHDKVLLGSNMLPTVHIEKLNDKVSTDDNTVVETTDRRRRRKGARVQSRLPEGGENIAQYDQMRGEQMLGVTSSTPVKGDRLSHGNDVEIEREEHPKQKEKESPLKDGRTMRSSSMLCEDEQNKQSKGVAKDSPIKAGAKLGKAHSDEQKDDKTEQKDEKTKQKGKGKQKSQSLRKKKGAINDVAEEDEGESWAPDELHRLHKALKSIPPSSQQFWLRVADVVGTRTEWECQEAHQSGLEGTKSSTTKAKSVASTTKCPQEPVALTATKGTMRRKRQLKDFIQQHNQNTEDDLFDSTPFKKKKKMTSKTLPNLVLAEEDDDDADDFSMKTPGSARLKTPSTHLRSLIPPLSGKKTPHTGFVSPGLIRSVEMKFVDQYIHGMQKKRPLRRGQVRKTPRSPPKQRPKAAQLDATPGNMTSSDIFQIDPIADRIDEDEEEGEADYYWSDED